MRLNRNLMTGWQASRHELARALTVALLLAVVLPAAGYGQGPALTVDRALEAARTTMEASRYCFLVTLDEAGHPQARLMEPFPAEADMTVWMATSSTTRKVRQLRRDSRATLAYYDWEREGYVTLIGEARLVSDIEQRRRRWRPEWQDFFPAGPTGPDYVLIQFTPSRIEVMSLALDVGEGAFMPTVLARMGAEWVLTGEQ